MVRASPAQQRRLLDLQRLDTAVRRLQHRRANLPEQKALDENADELARVSAELSSNRELLERLGVQQRRHEREIAAVDARRKSEEGRMYSGLITSERELEALRHELASLRGRKGELEDSLLELMQQAEDADGLVTRLAARREELTGRVGELTAARDRAATDIDAELAQRQGERDAVAGELTSELLSAYEELRRRKDGVAVAELEGRTCLGCRLELTASEMEEVAEQAASGLARCEQCGRILVPAAR